MTWNGAALGSRAVQQSYNTMSANGLPVLHLTSRDRIPVLSDRI